MGHYIAQCVYYMMVMVMMMMTKYGSFPSSFSKQLSLQAGTVTQLLANANATVYQLECAHPGEYLCFVCNPS
jgi:hypothetical protein